MPATTIGSAAPTLCEECPDGDGVPPVVGGVAVEGVAMVGGTTSAVAGGEIATAVGTGAVLVGLAVGARVGRGVGRAVGGGVGGGVAGLETVMLPCIAAYPWMVQ
jgi:hypothetical protein